VGWVSRQPSGKYKASYRGPDRKIYSQSFDRKRDGNLWLADKETSVNLGTWIDPKLGRTTFDRWADDYFALAVHKRPTTRARDVTVCDKHLRPVIGRMALAKIRPLDVRRVVEQMSRSLAPATVRTNYGVLRAILNAAVESEVIVASPCRGVKLPARIPSDKRFLSVEELFGLANTMPDEYRPMVLLAGFLGLRWSEIAGLRVGRIDFLRQTVHVQETLAEVNGNVMSADVKSRASRRTLSIPTPLRDMLSEHLAKRGGAGPHDYVFTAPDGGPLRASNFRYRVWAPAVIAAGHYIDVPDLNRPGKMRKQPTLTFHGLRHTAAGLMREVGAHTQVIAQRLGHSSDRVTSTEYGWINDVSRDGVANGLEELFNRSCYLAATSDTNGTVDSEASSTA
jgi:integrase